MSVTKEYIQYPVNTTYNIRLLLVFKCYSCSMSDLDPHCNNGCCFFIAPQDIAVRGGKLEIIDGPYCNRFVTFGRNSLYIFGRHMASANLMDVVLYHDQVKPFIKVAI